MTMTRFDVIIDVMIVIELNEHTADVFLSTFRCFFGYVVLWVDVEYFVSET